MTTGMNYCTGDKACGKPIPPGEEYRCLDCDAVMHKDCLRYHCGNDEKDREIYRQQQINQELRWQIARLCRDDASPAPTVGGARG